MTRGAPSQRANDDSAGGAYYARQVTSATLVSTTDGFGMIGSEDTVQRIGDLEEVAQEGGCSDGGEAN